MASIEELPSGRWRGVYRTAEGKRRSQTFTHKAAARRWATAQEHQVRDHGSLRDPARGRVRWLAHAEAWWPTRGLSSGAERSQRGLLRNHVAPRWGETELRAITHAAVQAWVHELGASLSASSTRQALYLLSSSLKSALREGLIEANPCTGVRLPATPPAPERYLSVVESDALIAAMPHHEHRVVAELLFETGMRIGEVVALHLDRVDLGRRAIDVVEAWDGIERVVQPWTKSRRRRSVPISSHLERVLRDHLADRPTRGQCGFDHAPGSTCRSPLVVVGPNGAVVDPHNYTNRTWKRALGVAQLGDARVHDTRHSYASRMVGTGVTLEELQVLLGHDSITTTQRYAHLRPGTHDRVRDRLDESRGTGRGTRRLNIV